MKLGSLRGALFHFLLVEAVLDKTLGGLRLFAVFLSGYKLFLKLFTFFFEFFVGLCDLDLFQDFLEMIFLG